MTLTLSSTVSQSLNQISAQLGDETVMMNIEKGNYYGLDSVGRKIWEKIAQPQTVGALCDQLVLEYAVDRSTCEKDVLKFLGNMLEQELITVQK